MDRRIEMGWFTIALVVLSLVTYLTVMTFVGIHRLCKKIRRCYYNCCIKQKSKTDDDTGKNQNRIAAKAAADKAKQDFVEQTGDYAQPEEEKDIRHQRRTKLILPPLKLSKQQLPVIKEASLEEEKH